MVVSGRKVYHKMVQGRLSLALGDKKVMVLGTIVRYHRIACWIYRYQELSRFIPTFSQFLLDVGILEPGRSTEKLGYRIRYSFDLFYLASVNTAKVKNFSVSR